MVMIEAPRPPLLEFSERPPADSWDLQVYPPATFLAWLLERTPPGQDRPDLAAGSIYPVGGRQALVTVDEQLPTVPSRGDYCALGTARPHVHVLLAATDTEGRPVTRDDVARAGAAAWARQTSRLIEYAISRHSIAWTVTGIEGVDASRVATLQPCPGLHDVPNVVIAGP